MESIGEEDRLPGLELFNSRQMFWMAGARMYCEQVKDDDLINQIKSRIHAPSKYRIIGPLQNDVNFAKDFNCKPGSGMNPNKKKCTLW